MAEGLLQTLWTQKDLPQIRKLLGIKGRNTMKNGLCPIFFWKLNLFVVLLQTNYSVFL